MLWWIFGLILVFSFIANLLRPKKRFDESENVIQEEERAKAQSWFGG
ncbi:hypothetical protein V1502_03135 [Bacillus sp. SCS-153A]